MYLDNKVVVHRGVDMMNQRAAGLTLDWASYYNPQLGRESRPKGGDICVLAKPTTENDVKMMSSKDWAAQNAGFNQATIDLIREFFYVCYQGAEESENQYYLNNDKFIKMKDVYMTFNLKDIDATQFGEIANGDTIMIDENGKIGTSSIATASAGYYNPAAAFVLKGTRVVGKSTTQSMIDPDVTLYTVTIVC